MVPERLARENVTQVDFEKWYADLTVAEVSFDDDPRAFANINTVDELKSLESLEQSPPQQR